MKRFIITLSLLVTFFLTGYAQAPSSSDSRHEGKNHHGHNSHDKGDRHRKGIRLFHGHDKKDYTQSGGHSHHVRKGHGEKKTNGIK